MGGERTERHGKLIRVEPPRLDRRFVLVIPGIWGLLGFDVDAVEPVTTASGVVAWRGLADGELVCQFPSDETYRLVPTAQVALAGWPEVEDDDPSEGDDDPAVRRGYM
ncbi:MAG: hypothetical protein QN141_13425 [Armatimonadota bacterium]|nr:hypothetical protein [Armatimonadota bacterium]MDR7559477.1 hypothetical protein [Armatimonadota bacterium]